MVKASRTEQGANSSRNTSNSRNLKVADGRKNISNNSVDRSNRDNMKHLDSNIDLGYSLNSRTIRKTKTAETLASAENASNS
jgi:hypothetical protein